MRETSNTKKHRNMVQSMHKVLQISS